MEKNPIIKIFNLIYTLLLKYSQYVLLAIVAIVSVDVCTRNLFHYSVKWSQEVSLLLIVWMTFLSMAIGVEKNTHIGIELFYGMFPKPVKRVVDVINKIAIIAIGIFFTYFGSKLTLSTWSSTLASTKWPAGMLYLMIPVGGFCMSFFTLLDLLGWKKYKRTHQYEDEEEVTLD